MEEIKCFKCGFTKHEEGANFCANCGFDLDSNYCTNERCMARNNGDPIPCRETDCYCDYCGSETAYFQQGLIKPAICNKE